MQREHLAARAVEPKEDGFTLLELMMVVLIIGILIAVLTPTFLGASNRGKDRAVQTSLTNATIGAKSIYLANADYMTATTAAMTAEVGGLTFLSGTAPSTGANSVYVNPVNTTQVVLSGQSKSGSCFYVLDNEVTGVTQYAKLPSAGGCYATGITPTDPAWKPAW